jgi:hypothetical protein
MWTIVQFSSVSYYEKVKSIKLIAIIFVVVTIT